jgi:hypothetical protein
VDRRFDRARYDAVREVESFAGRLAASVDPDAVTADLRAVLDRTVAPHCVGTWVRTAPTAGTGVPPVAAGAP